MAHVGEDHISALPDELLHGILVRLGSARAAARTSVLSRRWRPLWAHLPMLLLDGHEAPSPGSSFMDTVDAALGAYSAPTLECLKIAAISASAGSGIRIPPHRLTPWLRFASLRVVDMLILRFPESLFWFLSPPESAWEGAAPQLELPACATAKTIVLTLQGSWRLRLVGVFGALTRLEICMARMEGSELTALVCKQCPILRDLVIYISLVAASDVSVCSHSLRILRFYARHTKRLQIVAPELEELKIFLEIEAIHVSAPKLAKIVWRGGAYDPRHHQFADVGRRLKLLDIGQESTAVSLLQHFDEVHELKVRISIANGIAGYESFLNETNKLPKCETLKIMMVQNQHGLVPGLLHLLRRCSSIRKLFVDLFNPGGSLMYSCPSACPCRLVESCKIEDIALTLLEEVEINSFVGSREEMEFVLQLPRCSGAVLKKLAIYYKRYPAPPLTKELCEKVRSMCPTNLKVEFYVMLEWRWELFD